ncbi:MAG: response regulator, partial [Myxococcales bacterium]|nr:response regulator [Myxococcales bacterium]
VGSSPRNRPSPMETPSAPIPRLLRALVVDDDPDSRRLAATILSLGGYEAEPVEDGWQALERLERRAYDLILLDLQMPGMDGIELSRTIRAREAERGDSPVSILALSAHPHAAYRSCFAALGIGGHLSKPVSGQDLLRAVHERIDPRPHALIVEPNEDDRRRFERLIEGFGYRAGFEDSLEEGCRRLSRCASALLLVSESCIEPGTSPDRLERVVGRVRGPAILLTRLPPARRHPLRLPFAAVLSKREIEPELRDSLRRLLRRGSDPERVAPLEPALEPTAGDGCLAPRSAAPLVVDVDPEIADLVHGYLRRCREIARKMLEHLERGEYEPIGRRGHDLKGSGPAYGFDRLGELGEAIEAAVNGGHLDRLDAPIAELERYLREVRWRVAET